MTQPQNRTPEERMESALARFLAEGFARREPLLLQPASVFLDRLGEDFRGRLFLTADGDAQLCLRPEYTIPIALDYLAEAEPKAPATLAYGGAVFRIGEGQRLQAGLESFGRDDREAADAEILGLALEAAALAGAPRLRLRLGDAGLTKTFLDRLDLAPAWRRRLDAVHAPVGKTPAPVSGEALKRMLSPPTAPNGKSRAGVLAALEKADAAGARKLIEDLLAIAGISSVGGRSAGEIAERFLEQASLESGLAPEKLQLIEAFFAIDGAPDAASAALRKLGDDARLGLGEALDVFDTRSSFIAARGLPLEEMRFSTRFAHSIDYYSGFMFEARPDGRGDEALPMLAGGRYDGLLKTLGAAQEIPAVGAALWINRIAGDAS